MNYNVNLTIEANDKTEVAEKMQAVKTLVTNLEHKDLIAVTKAIEDMPELVIYTKNVVADLDDKEINLMAISKSIMKTYRKLKKE